MLMFLQSGEIDFAPLTTEYFWHVDASDEETDAYASRWFEAHLLRRSNISDMQASPKSIYRLADKMGLDDLKQQAKEAYISMIDPDVSVWMLVLDRALSLLADEQTLIECNLRAPLPDMRAARRAAALGLGLHQAQLSKGLPKRGYAKIRPGKLPVRRLCPR